METAVLTSAYWDSEAPDLRLNPRGTRLPHGLEEFVRGEERLRGHVLFATSGSSGEPKLAALSKSGLLTAARWVNLHLGCGPGDRWIVSLPGFHVGGFGILVRAHVARGLVVPGGERWGATRFAAQVGEEEVTVASLVRTQVHDLVTASLPAPACLRMAIVGGSPLEPDLWDRAVELGWPIRRSYGMTETGAQVATQTRPDPALDLPLIEGWEARETDGFLALRGTPLLSGYVEVQGGRWSYRDPKDAGGWFVTGDRGQVLEGGRIKMEGRGGRIVKVLGEFVDLDRLETVLHGLGEGLIHVLPDERAGSRIILVTETAEEGEALRQAFNARVAPFERIAEVRPIDRIPVGDLGKPRRAEVDAWLARGE